MVERVLYTHLVAGSIPVLPTGFRHYTYLLVADPFQSRLAAETLES